MSYGKLGQSKPGTRVVTREDDNTQKGSRSNQSAMNIAKRGAKVATSDTYPRATRETSAASPSRPAPDPLTTRGYKSARTATSNGPIRKVGKKITRQRM